MSSSCSSSLSTCLPPAAQIASPPVNPTTTAQEMADKSFISILDLRLRSNAAAAASIRSPSTADLEEEQQHARRRRRPVVKEKNLEEVKIFGNRRRFQVLDTT